MADVTNIASIPTFRDRILRAVAGAQHAITAREIAADLGCTRRMVSPDLAVFMHRGWVTRELVSPGSTRFRYTVTASGLRHLQDDEKPPRDELRGDGGCLLQSLWR